MRRVLAVLSAAFLVGACHTITEDLPTRPTANVVLSPGQPLVVQPVPLPTQQPGANPAPAPAPDTPGPIPSPTEVSPPTSGNPQGGDIPNNNNPVARIGIKIFFVECGGVQVPDSEGGNDAPVGCRVHLDGTCKDAGNKPTRARGTPHWHLDDDSLVSLNIPSPYNPVLATKGSGTLHVTMDVDGVTSNTLTIHIH